MFQSKFHELFAQPPEASEDSDGGEDTLDQAIGKDKHSYMHTYFLRPTLLDKCCKNTFNVEEDRRTTSRDTIYEENEELRKELQDSKHICLEVKIDSYAKLVERFLSHHQETDVTSASREGFT